MLRNLMLPLLTACNLGLESTIVPSDDTNVAGVTDVDGDGFSAEDGDCDDEDGTAFPGGEELCDGVDNDCDGSIDEESDVTDGDLYFTDADGDGFGDKEAPRVLCEQLEGTVDNDLDCDDSDDSEPVVVDALAGAPTGIGSIDAPLDTIQAGISAATTCVAVYPGVYTEAVTFDGKDLHVFGVEGPEQTTIDATGQSDSAVRFEIAESSAAILEGFTLTGGSGNLTQESTTYACTSMYDCTEYYDIHCGGGVYISGADPTLRDLVIQDNVLAAASSTTDGIDTWYVHSYGGGICVDNGTISLSDVTIESNSADQGGGLFVDLTSAATLTRGWLLRNDATSGGGIMVQGGSLSMQNVGLLSNTAASDGGCLAVEDGAEVDASFAVLSRCTAATGSGVWIGEGRLSIDSSIAYQLSTGGAFAGSPLAVFAGTFNNLYGNTDGDFIGITPPVDPDTIGADPMFVDPVVLPGDWHLAEGSPSIDAGNLLLTDLDATRADQGAYGGPESWAE